MKSNKLYIILSPLLTGLTLLLVYRIYGLYPFGNNTLAWCDMTQQALPLMMQAGDYLSGANKGFYSLVTAGGMNILGVFLFFVASPFTLLSPLIDGSKFLLWANILVLLKLMCSALSFSIWCDYILKGKYQAITIILSLSYAVSGYSLMYYQNNIWLDIMYIFPLLMLFTVRLLKDNQCLGFIAILSWTLITNYYISFCILLFLIFFCGFYIFFHKEEIKPTTALSLGLSVLSSLLLTAPVWITSFMQYLVSARSDDSAIGTTKLLTNIPTTFGIIIPTCLVVVSLLLIILDSKKTPLKLTLFYSLIIMLIAIPLDPINRIWHLGSYQAFPVRYAFIPILLGLTITALAIGSFADEKVGEKAEISALILLTLSTLGCGAVAYLLQQNKHAELISYLKTLWVSKESFRLLLIPFLLCLVTAVSAAVLYKLGKINYRILTTCLCGIVVIEAIFSSTVYIGGAAKNGTYLYWIDDLSNRVAVDDSEFYRVKTSKKLFDVNWLGAIGYPNLAHYTSLTTQDYLFTMKALGYSAYWMEVGGYGGSLLSDIFLQNNYVVSPKQTPYPLAENEEYRSNAYVVEKQRFNAPIGNIVPGNADNFASLPNLTRLQTSDKLFRTLYQSDEPSVTVYPFTRIINATNTMYGDAHYIDRKDTEIPSAIHYSVTITEPTALYFDCFDGYSNKLREKINSSLSIYLDGQLFTRGYPSQSNNGLVLLGVFENTDVEIEVQIHKDFVAHSLGLFGVNLNTVEEALVTAPDDDINMAIEDDCFFGTAYNIYDEGFLVLPFPYDDGFELTINGEDAEVKKVFGTFIGIPLKSGENAFRLTFKPKGSTISLVLLVIGIALTILLSSKKSPLITLLSGLSRVVLILFYAVFIVGIFIVYINPMIGYILR